MSKPVSIKEKVQEWQRSNYYTPDIPNLYEYDGHLVLFYGTLKSGHGRHDFIARQEGVKFQGIARTLNEFELVNTTFSFPVALKYPDMLSKGILKGELWYVPTNVILALDRLESNGLMYDRTTENVEIIRSPKGKKEVLPAFVYIGKTDFWRARSYVFLDLPLRVDNRLKPYYWYSLEDERGTEDQMVERFGSTVM